jgi:DNA mismatch endonuclease (patch repair protein)
VSPPHQQSPKHVDTGCKKTRTPKTNSIFWENKFELNIARDKLILDKYSKLGWNVIIVWECEIETTNKLQETILNTIDKIINNYN